MSAAWMRVCCGALVGAIPNVVDVRTVRSRAIASDVLFAEVTIGVDAGHDGRAGASHCGHRRGENREGARRGRSDWCTSSRHDESAMGLQRIESHLAYADSSRIPMAYRPRSLKHEYELFVEREIENYKERVARKTILGIGDEAVKSLEAQQQLALTELLLCEEVDRIIRARLGLPSSRPGARSGSGSSRNSRSPRVGECAPTARSHGRWPLRTRDTFSSPARARKDARSISRRTVAM